MVMPRGWKVGIRRAGQGKTVPASFQQDRGRGSLDGRTSEIRKWAWTFFQKCFSSEKKAAQVKLLFIPTPSFSFT